MKRIFTLTTFLAFTFSGVFSQISTGPLFPQSAGIIPLGGNAVAWDAPTAAKINSNNNIYCSTVPNFPQFDDYSDFLTATNFGFAIPAGSTIVSIEVSIRRKALKANGVKDNRLILVKNDGFGNSNVVGSDDAETTNTWGTGEQTIGYDGDGGNGGNPLWGYAWTAAEINDPAFGVALAVSLDPSALPLPTDYRADVEFISIEVTYFEPLPIILTNFSVKNQDAKVGISFTTETETKVKNLFIERSADGKNYTDLFTIQPKGGDNIRTTYNLTDAAPLLGTNYYRLKEVDIDGKWYYYETRVIKMSNVSAKFQAYQNSGKVVVNFNNQPGNYTLSLIDMNGSIVSTKNFRVDKQSVQVSFDPPVKRTGIYLVNLKGGDNFNESRKLFIQR